MKHERMRDGLLLAVLIVCLGGIIALIPGAMQAETEYQQQIAESRCIKNGDFDDSTEYCRAVAKEMGQ